MPYHLVIENASVCCANKFTFIRNKDGLLVSYERIMYNSV